MKFVKFFLLSVLSPSGGIKLVQGEEKGVGSAPPPKFGRREGKNKSPPPREKRGDRGS